MKIKNLIIFICVLPLLSACSDFLEVKDESSINPAIWDNENSAKLYINSLYSMCMPAFGGEEFGLGSLANISDETSDMGSTMLLGSMTSGSVSTLSSLTYRPIRFINVAFKEMETSSLTGDERNRVLGQLYFLRAWQHWKMINLYGGIPYMKDVVDYESDEMVKNAPRNKTSECIQFMKEDLALAIQYLPATWPVETEYARITRGAAAAFLGRVLLFYASPQFNPTNDANRWKEAYDANLAAKELCTQDGYSLMNISTAVTKQWPVATDFNKIFITKRASNPEVLIVTPYLKALKFHGYEMSVRPVETTQAAKIPSNCPTWDLVIAFPMKDGRVAYDKNRKFIGNADINKYYLNRDPRFYATVAFNGSYYPLDGNGSRRQWTYSGGEAATSNLTTLTGFYCRKMVNPEISGDERSKTSTDWIEMRYAEVLLNLAECAFEYEGANSQLGYDCLIEIRKRAGIEAGTDGYYGLKLNPVFTPIELVLNERRVEMAFEGKRIFDLRRRNMFTADLGTNTLKLNGWRKSGSGYRFDSLAVASPVLYKVKRDTIAFERIYAYFKMTAKTSGPAVKGIAYKCVETQEALKTHVAGSYNFFDIPDGILTRSPAIVQTNGWANGQFDPFE